MATIHAEAARCADTLAAKSSRLPWVPWPASSALNVFRLLSDRYFCLEPRHYSDWSLTRSDAVIQLGCDSSRSKTLVWVGEPRAEHETVSTSDFGIPAIGIHPRRITYCFDVCSVLNFHVWLHVHDVLTRLAHHLLLRLRMRVGSVCHHGQLAGVAHLWSVALVGV